MVSGWGEGGRWWWCGRGREGGGVGGVLGGMRIAGNGEKRAENEIAALQRGPFFVLAVSGL